MSMPVPGRTLLHEAAAANRLDECSRLLQLGFSADARDRLGITPLDEAEARGFMPTAALLRARFKSERKSWTLLEMTCPICFGLLWMPVEAGECGHVFCRSCLQQSRRGTNNRCPVCRAAVTLPTGFQPNAALTYLARTQLPLEWARTEAEQRSNAVETAITNLLTLGAALGLGDQLVFNAAGSCCLLIDGEFVLHVTLLPGKRLFVYAPVLIGLPSTQLARVALCERILLGALENDEDVPGGVGILQEQQLIIYHRELNLADAPPDALKSMCGPFVVAVKRWRSRVKEALETAEGVKLAPVSPASKRRACRPMPAQPLPLSTDLADIARLAIAKASIDQFLASAGAQPISYERSGAGLLVRLQGLSIRYLPACDRILLASPLLEDDSVLSDEDMRLRIYEELLSASAFGSHTPAGGAALDVKDSAEPRLVLYAAIQCDKLRGDFISDFSGTVLGWRTRLREITQQQPRLLNVNVGARERASPRVSRCAQGCGSPVTSAAVVK